MNESPAIRSLMTRLDRLLGDVVELRQSCVPLIASRADDCTIRSKGELLDHRARLFAADPHCHYCQESLNFSQCTLDHLRPKSRGGDDSDSNLVLACGTCNGLKGALTEDEFRSAVESGQIEIELAVAS